MRSFPRMAVSLAESAGPAPLILRAESPLQHSEWRPRVPPPRLVGRLVRMATLHRPTSPVLPPHDDVVSDHMRRLRILISIKNSHRVRSVTEAIYMRGPRTIRCFG